MRRSLALAFLVSLAAACGTVTPLSTADGGGGAPGSGGATATGGRNGSGGQGGGETCDQIAADYQAALTAGRACTPSAQNQCQKPVTDRLGCGGCTTFVNTDSNLSQIENSWNQHDCQANMACPAIACVPPTSATCKAGDAGGGTCVDQGGLAAN